MATLGNTPRPSYVYDTETDTWVPIGVGAHTHGYIPNTLVDAKGDIITATADDTPAKLSKGADGTVLVSDSTTSTGLAWQPYASPVTSGKNAIINGGMDIWQRGTSFSSQAGLGAAAFTADRMHVYRGTGASGVTTTRQSSGLTGFNYCARIQRNSGDTDTNLVALRHTIETSDSLRFAGQVVTFSFYARKGATFSPTTSNLTINFAYGTGVDQPVYSFTNWAQVTGSATNISLTNTWQRYTVTGTVSASATEIGFELYFAPSGTAGASDYFEITGMQLEAGPVATTFSRAGGSLQGELAACQRYYYRHVVGSMQPVSLAFYWSGTQLQTTIPFPVTMRAAPTLDATSGTSYYRVGRNATSQDINGFALSIASQNAADIYNNGQASGTAGWAGTLYTINGSSYIGFTAEL